MDNQGTPLSSWPDRELVVAFKGGVPGAYEEMYRRYSDRVMGVCRRMLGSSEDAREATQETFLKAYQALPRFNGEYKLGAWLGRIASNVCVDHIRRRGRNAIVTPLTENHEGLRTELGPEDVVVHDAPALRALQEIQPLHARALELRNLEGLSHKEIAQQLSMTPMQVKALLHRARMSFKRVWDDASSWVLAPLTTLRSFLEDNTKDASHLTQVPMFSHMTAPLIAEKVTASAMVVAIALSGAAVVDSATSPSAPIIVPRQDSPMDAAAGAASLDVDTPGTQRLQRAEDKQLVAGLDELVEIVEETTERETRDDTKDHEDPDENDGDIDPNDPGKASGKLVTKVKDTIEEVVPSP